MLPSIKPRPAAGRGAPPLIVIPLSNQHIAPALSPARTMPRSHAERIVSSTPCSRHTASRLRIEPPPT